MLDKKEWIELLTKAKKGDGDAQSKVGDSYSDGLKNSIGETIVKKSDKRAFNWYSKSALQENKDGLTCLAYCLSEGLGCQKNVQEAIKIYQKAIKKGSSNSAFNLGTIYRDNGKFEKAFEYYSLAMTIDNSDYSLKVGLCYYYGIGISMDKQKAIEHFKKVSKDRLTLHNDYEIDEANFYIGLSYLTGEGLTKSIPKAKKYLEMANKDKDHGTALELIFLIGRARQ